MIYVLFSHKSFTDYQMGARCNAGIHTDEEKRADERTEQSTDESN